MRVQKFKRGQIWWCKFSTSFDGSVQGKTRPIIIISNDLANKHSNCLLGIPTTTQIKKDMPTHTVFELNNNMCTALAENLMSVNSNNLTDYIGSVDDELLFVLEDTVRVALGLNKYNGTPLKLQDLNMQSTTTEIITEIKDDNISEPKVITKRASKLKYNDDSLKIEFINNYKEHDIDWMMTYYDEVSPSAVSNKYYRFKQNLKERGIEV